MKEKLNQIFADNGRYTAAELCKMTGCGREQTELLEKVLKSMCAEGQLYRSKSGKYGRPAAFGLLSGTISASGRGFCFLRQENDDVFIPAKSTAGALNGDTVTVRMVDAEKREGEVTGILKHANTSVVGTVVNQRGRHYLEPDNKKIEAFIRLVGKAKAGTKAVCSVTYLSDGSCEGRVTETLGQPDSKGVDILCAARSFGLKKEFPEEVLAEAERVSAEKIVPSGRADLRNEKVFTVDGDDARDFDDAISLSKDGKNYLLNVHIADVSHYVTAGSALDAEARRRTTSVYFPGEVFHMLPQTLSCGSCSINEGVDRYAITAQMSIDAHGAVYGFKVFPSIIHSCRRLTYRKVQAFFDGQGGCDGLQEELSLAYKLYKILKQKRTERGAIDFDLPEPEFTLNEAGIAVDVRAAERAESNMMIEQFMLEANECVAKFMSEKGLPAIYRVHENPDSERIKELNRMLSSFGLGLPVKLTPLECANLVRKVAGTPEELLVSRSLLRSMQKAKYSDENTGHFGLAAVNYLHFTSPIRRYPDLTVHRMLHFFFEGNKPALDGCKKEMHDLAAKCSEGEVNAVEAERTADDIKRTQYAASIIGKEYQAVISGMSNNVMWAELDNTVEGVIPFSSMHGDFYLYDKESCTVKGEHTGKSYRFGDKIKIRIRSTDTEKSAVYFELLGKA